jgi:hypothetical protein
LNFVPLHEETPTEAIFVHIYIYQTKTVLHKKSRWYHVNHQSEMILGKRERKRDPTIAMKNEKKASKQSSNQIARVLRHHRASRCTFHDMIIIHKKKSVQTSSKANAALQQLPVVELVHKFNEPIHCHFLRHGEGGGSWTTRGQGYLQMLFCVNQASVSRVFP